MHPLKEQGDGFSRAAGAHWDTIVGITDTLSANNSVHLHR
jgi:hypothetical protein